MENQNYRAEIIVLEAFCQIGKSKYLPRDFIFAN